MTPAPESVNGPARRLQVLFRSQCRLSLGREPRLNVDAGVFVSYIGLFSYYNLTTDLSAVLRLIEHTLFFNGLRVQCPEQTLKIEPCSSTAGSPTRSSTAIRASAVRSCGSRRLVQAGLQHLQYRARQSRQAVYPQQRRKSQRRDRAPNPNAHYINYANVTRVHEDDSVE